MNPQERDQLTQFLGQLAEARVVEKNAQADALIREAVAKQPDAAYLLVQRAMLVEQALNTAKAQIAQLQSQLQAQGPQAGNRNAGFLGGGNPWAQSLDGGANPGGVPGAGNYQIPRGGAPFANAAPAAASFGAAPAGGVVGSFLGSMATTAAGVVAGGFLFQGIENLIGGHHPQASSIWGGDSPAERVSEQTTINNYYDTPPGSESARDDDDVGGFLAGNDADPLFDDSGDDDSSWT